MGEYVKIIQESFIWAVILGLAGTLISVAISVIPRLFGYLLAVRDNSPEPMPENIWRKILIAFLKVVRIAVLFIFGLTCVMVAIALGWQGIVDGVLPWLFCTIALAIFVIAACCFMYATNLSLKLG